MSYVMKLNLRLVVKKSKERMKRDLRKWEKSSVVWNVWDKDWIDSLNKLLVVKF